MMLSESNNYDCQQYLALYDFNVNFSQPNETRVRKWNNLLNEQMKQDNVIGNKNVKSKIKYNR